MSQLRRFVIIAIVALLVTGTTGYIVSAHGGHDDPAVTVPSTGEEPIGSPVITDPTPVWATPDTNPGDPSVDPGIITELPSTGAGTTARASPQRNHTGWIFVGYSCPWYGDGLYAVYGYAYGHGSAGNHLFSDYRVYLISPWC